MATSRTTDKMQGMFLVRSDVYLDRKSLNNIKRINVVLMTRKSSRFKIKLRVTLLMELKIFK